MEGGYEVFPVSSRTSSSGLLRASSGSPQSSPWSAHDGGVPVEWGERGSQDYLSLLLSGEYVQRVTSHSD